MEQPGVIAEYAGRLAAELDFDPSLSRRVHREVEDHLHDTVAVDPSSDRADAERRAIARFGDLHVIAARFTAAAVVRQTRGVAVVAVAMIAAVFVAMKARVAWYGVMAWGTDVPMGALVDVVLKVDRLAFGLAALVGVAGWLYIGSRRVPVTLTRDCRVQLGRFSALCLTATAALVASVMSDSVLTALRLARIGWRVDFVPPVLLLAAEIGCAAVLLAHLRRTARLRRIAGCKASVSQAASCLE